MPKHSFKGLLCLGFFFSLEVSHENYSKNRVKVVFLPAVRLVLFMVQLLLNSLLDIQEATRQPIKKCNPEAKKQGKKESNLPCGTVKSEAQE